jgi:protease I
MELEGKKVVIPVEEMFNTHEFWYPYYRLKEAGCEVVVMGSGSAETYTGKPGTEVTVDVNADQVSASEFDGIVIPGGYAPDKMRRYPMLASAEILQGKSVTSVSAIKDDLVHAGASWVDQEVVVDGNIITSRTPDDLPAFMRAIIHALI